MIHVYLDDMRPCPKGFTLAKNAEECIMLLEECEVGILSLDHDLGWGSKQTGMDVAHWIVQHRKFPRHIYIHTSSLSAGAKMYQILYMAKPESAQVHPSKIPEELLARIALEA